MNMSERTLNRHFQQQTGLSYSEWLRRARLLEALVRLAQGQPVLRVALDLGYGSHSAFTAMLFRAPLSVSALSTAASSRIRATSASCACLSFLFCSCKAALPASSP